MRTYKLMRVGMTKDAPGPGELFPSLDFEPTQQSEDADDEMIFQAVTAQLTPYSEK